MIYFGLGAAYFCNKDGAIGGVGKPTSKGWRWQRRDEIAAVVSSAIARYRDDKQPKYVPLPVEVVKVREADKND